ncbi:5-methylthioadenosine/S-adenosylhomocysteine nucleosidase 2-like [Sesbania bispinosa]|nr:5-methylthioadenosine/S-adenosylhomocysteine nucleosidase 2-like [Sesbania bispinosa]
MPHALLLLVSSSPARRCGCHRHRNHIHLPKIRASSSLLRQGFITDVYCIDLSLRRAKGASIGDIFIASDCAFHDKEYPYSFPPGLAIGYWVVLIHIFTGRVLYFLCNLIDYTICLWHSMIENS